MATSGTVSTTVFEIRRVIDRIYGRCKIPPQKITGEMQNIALDHIYLVLSTLSSRAFTLWTLQRQIYPLYQGIGTVPTLQGTVDVYDVNYRSAQRSIPGSYTSSLGGSPANLFDGNFTTACTQTGLAGNVNCNFGSATQVDTVGLLANSSQAAVQYTFQGSPDNVNWTTLYTSATYAQTVGAWTWFDMSNHTAFQYFRVVGGPTTTIDLSELYLGGTLSEIPMYRFNRNEYEFIPNKYFQSRPLQYWYDRQLPQQGMVLWPIPGVNDIYSSVTVRYQRYIQDVGTLLTNTLEVPQYWLEGVISKVGYSVAREMPLAQMPYYLLAQLRQEAEADLQFPLNEEVDRGPFNIRPYLRPYTR